MRMVRSIPALPVSNIDLSNAFYRDVLGFTLVHTEDGFSILRRDGAEIHIWAANDQDWPRRRPGSPPVVSGAESFLAGTASCRIEVQGVAELHTSFRPLGILHGKGQLDDTWYGTQEFAVVDLDNNLITFFEDRSANS